MLRTRQSHYSRARVWLARRRVCPRPGRAPRLAAARFRLALRRGPRRRRFARAGRQIRRAPRPLVLPLRQGLLARHRYPMTGLADDQVFDSERMLALIQQEILNSGQRGQLRDRGPRRGLRAGQPARLLPRLRLRHRHGQARLVRDMPFPSRPTRPSRLWPPSTSAAPRSSASPISRSGARAAFITCC